MAKIDLEALSIEELASLRDHATENDDDQCQPAGRSARAHSCRLRKPHECEQEEKREVDANIHPEQSPCGK